MSQNDGAAIEEEMGDLIFSVVSLCRKLGVDSEVALNKATEKFIMRFSALEQVVLAEGKDIMTLDMSELDAIWEKNKKSL